MIQVKGDTTPHGNAGLVTWKFSRKNLLQYCSSSTLVLFFCMLLIANEGKTQQLALSPVITSGLSSPMQLVNAGDGTNRVFIVQKGGTIRSYDGGFNFLSTFLTVTGITNSGERGLLSMVFHPAYATNGFFFVYYVNTAGDLELARYKVSSDPNVADATSRVILITIPHQAFTNHNGGELHFGHDGFLYLSTGDGGGGGDAANNAQNTAVLLGKMLRFDVNTSATAPYYSIPAGNPYNNEIYDLGLRNPYRWSFDRQTHDMWIGDVGQDSWEEINFRSAATAPGTNYGWRCYEGNSPYNTAGCGPASSYTFPAYTYPSQDPSASITGGVVYRGAFYAVLQGLYICADFYSGVFYKIRSDDAGGWNATMQTISPTGMVDFGETEDGEVFAVSHTGNSVFRIIPSNLAVSDLKGDQDEVIVAPSVIEDGRIHVNIDPKAGYSSLEVWGMNGAVLLRENIADNSGELTINARQLSAGMYLLRVNGNTKTAVTKILIK